MASYPDAILLCNYPSTMSLFFIWQGLSKGLQIRCCLETCANGVTAVWNTYHVHSRFHVCL